VRGPEFVEPVNGHAFRAVGQLADLVIEVAGRLIHDRWYLHRERFGLQGQRIRQ
jgi:hypothetical protein